MNECKEIPYVYEEEQNTTRLDKSSVVKALIGAQVGSSFIDWCLETFDSQRQSSKHANSEICANNASLDRRHRRFF
jgi:hypothetical protein